MAEEFNMFSIRKILGMAGREEVADASAPRNARIKVIGSGCARCRSLLAVVREAAGPMGLSSSIEYVTDIRQAAALGVMSMPALAVDGKVVLEGRVPGRDEAARIIASALKEAGK